MDCGGIPGSGGLGSGQLALVWPLEENCVPLVVGGLLVQRCAKLVGLNGYLSCGGKSKNPEQPSWERCPGLSMWLLRQSLCINVGAVLAGLWGREQCALC